MKIETSEKDNGASSSHSSQKLSITNLPANDEELEVDNNLRKIPNSDYITDEVLKRYVGSKESLSSQEIRMLLRDSRDSILRHYKDRFDYSNTPSFNQLKSPYPLICRERYRLAKKQYEHQLQTEIQQIINQQEKAFDAICFVRVMAITSLWPPLHTCRDVEHTHQHYFQLTPKQRKRLSFIMGVDWSKT
ncbi:uncharacterized protein LOC133328699 [Musca vetustissima]|uniref:uncharacterized protein LOC133328699 n=1 Tax=Musca vetustissima TaxID=27455 RepID=UPI002AB6542A|nr:uncharacterized protein LOC133328699 [Musca vetustissima]